MTAVVGFLDAWANRFFISPDGLNYLDIASAYLRGEGLHAVNAYWSPFFSWLLALALRTVHPSPSREIVLLHTVNFAGLLFSLACFEYFLEAFVRAQRQSDQAAVAEDGLGELGYRLLGYGVFISTAFFVLPTPSTTTPDVWVFALTFLAAGLLVRIREEPEKWRRYAALGFVLGCAYLTKTFYFPLSFVFIAAASAAGGFSRKGLPRTVLALAVFGMVAGPWVGAISHAKGRWTFGDVGKLAYAEIIDGVEQPAFWQGENSTGAPVHPIRLIFTQPRVFEFATPIRGTYPPVYDWSYWLEGMKPHFDLRGQLRALRQSFGTFFLFFLGQTEYAVGFAVLFFQLRDRGRWMEAVRRHAFLWIPALIALAAYAVVLVEGRYIAPFLPLLWLAAFASAVSSRQGISQRMLMAVVLATTCFTGVRLFKSAVSDAAAISSKQENTNWVIASGLRAQGVHPGDPVSAIGGIAGGYWARLAGVRIVSEVPLGDERLFWAADSQTKSRVLAALSGTGARVVIAANAPANAENEGWVPLGTTSFCVKRLPHVDQ